MPSALNRAAGHRHPTRIDLQTPVIGWWLFLSPKGIESSSPALLRRRSGYAGLTVPVISQL